MKLLLVAACAFTVAQAANPISDRGCQCTAACDTCLTQSLANSDCIGGQKHCPVDIALCTDASWAAKEEDKCGSLWEDATSAVAGVTNWFKNEENIQGLVGKMSGWVEENLQAIDIDALLSAGTAKLASFASAWDKLDKSQWDSIKAMGAEQWTKLVADIPIDELVAMAKESLDQIDTTKLVAIKERFAAITLEDVAAWTDEQWKKVPIDNLALMGWEALQKIPLEELGTFTQEQWKKIPIDSLVKFSGDQIAKIDAATLASLGDEYWDKVPVYQIVHFGTELLQSAGVMESLNATHIAQLTSDQWKDVPIESVTKFTLDKLQAIDYKALGNWTKDVWDKVPLDTVLKFAGDQIKAIPSDTVGAWTQEQWLKFDASNAVMFTGTQLAAGADVLKGMTEEQLAKFDWSEMTEDLLSQLPDDLRAKVEKLAKENAPLLKDLVAKASAAKDRMNQKLKELQEKMADSKATQAEKDAAQVSYDESKVSYEAMTLEVTTETTKVNAGGDSAGANDDASASARTAALPLLACALLASLALAM